MRKSGKPKGFNVDNPSSPYCPSCGRNFSKGDVVEVIDLPVGISQQSYAVCPCGMGAMVNETISRCAYEMEVTPSDAYSYKEMKRLFESGPVSRRHVEEIVELVDGDEFLREIKEWRGP